MHMVQGTSPIYNLLPDMLSSLSSEASLPQEQFQAIMRHLLTFIAKEKQIDSLVEKLCLRFAATQVCHALSCHVFQRLLFLMFQACGVLHCSHSGAILTRQAPSSHLFRVHTYRDARMLWYVSLCQFLVGILHASHFCLLIEGCCVALYGKPMRFAVQA